MSADLGMLMAGNGAIADALKDLAVGILEANKVVRSAIHGERELKPGEIQILEELEVFCENYNMAIAQYMEEILNINRDLSPDD